MIIAKYIQGHMLFNSRNSETERRVQTRKRFFVAIRIQHDATCAGHQDFTLRHTAFYETMLVTLQLTLTNSRGFGF
jgi:hypothetical protein